MEQGLLSLDATVESVVPEFGQLQVLDGFDGDKPRLRPPASEATVRQLMTHSAGLGYFFLDGRFVQAWLNDGAGILAAATVQMALQNHLGRIKLPELMKFTMPELSNDVPSLPVPQSWGLGFHLTLADLPGMRSAGTADWAGVFNSYYWIDRSKGIGGVLMTQLPPFFDMPVIETLMGFEMAVYQQVGAAVPAA